MPPEKGKECRLPLFADNRAMGANLANRPNGLHYLNIRVSDLELSVRSTNCLRIARLTYVGDLVQKTREDLLHIRNLGRRSLNEIERVLGGMNLKLGLVLDKDWREITEREWTEGLVTGTKKKLFSVNDKEVADKLVRKIGELDLPFRAFNCLTNLGVKYVGDLVQKTPADLLKVHNFGRKTLKDVMGKLSSIGLSLGVMVEGWPELRIEVGSGTGRKNASTKGGEPLFVPDIPRAQSLEEELYYLTSLAKDKHRQIVARYYGWDGEGKKTLEVCGLQAGLTRERVRQIIQKFETRVRATNFVAGLKLPILDQVLQLIAGYIPNKKKTIEEKLLGFGLMRKRFDIEGVRTACLLLKRRMPFCIARYRKEAFVVPVSSQKVISAIVYQARKLNSSFGIATASDTAAEAAETVREHVDESFVTSVLSSYSDFQCLDESGGWFWSPLARKNPLVNVIRKILSVSGQIEVSELRAGVSRGVSRFHGFVPPRRVLLALCHHLSWCKVDGTMIEADPPLDWDRTLTASREWGICAVLKEYGPVMSKSELEKRCCEIGVTEASFSAILSYSPVIKRFAQGVYGLRGANISPAIVESLREESNRARRLKVDFGWTKDGWIWLVRELSEGAIRSGVISMPGAMHQHAQGVFELMAPDNVVVGQLKIKGASAWGLGPYFRRRGGEPGDYLAIMLDKSSYKATVYAGGEELMDEFALEKSLKAI